MNRLFQLKRWVLITFYVSANLICISIGKGTPVFCLALGLLTGWYSTRRELAAAVTFSHLLARVMRTALITSAFTLVVMVILWGTSFSRLWGSGKEIKNLNIPLLLNTPQSSLITWLLLMVLVLPFLQLVLTIFAAFLTLLRRLGIYERAIRRMG